MAHDGFPIRELVCLGSMLAEGGTVNKSVSSLVVAYMRYARGDSVFVRLRLVGQVTVVLRISVVPVCTRALICRLLSGLGATALATMMLVLNCQHLKSKNSANRMHCVGIPTS